MLWIQSIVWNYYIQPYKCCLKCMPYFIVRIDNRHSIFRPSGRGELWSVHCEDLEKNYGVISGVYDISRGPGRNMIFVIYIYIYKHLACFCLKSLVYQTTRCMCLAKNHFVFKHVVCDFVVKVIPLSWKYIYIYIATWYYVMVYSNFPLQKTV